MEQGWAGLFLLAPLALAGGQRGDQGQGPDPTVQTQSQFLAAKERGASELFGRPVAASGGTAVVSEWYEGYGAEGRGAVYVYRRSGGRWVFDAKLEANPGSRGDQFGRSVAVSGNTILVGAPSISGGADRCLVYVFTRGDGGWRHADTWEGRGWFGGRVAIDGERALVSSLVEGAGAVYVYEREGTEWHRAARLSVDTDPAAQFGDAVALSGELVAVTANTIPGHVYVFERAGDDWRMASRLPRACRGFKTAVALSGSDLLVRAGDEVRVFRPVRGVWTLVQSVAAPESAFRFTSLSVDGALAVVGATTRAPGGAAFVLRREKGAWAIVHELRPGPNASREFGDSVAIADESALASSRFTFGPGGAGAGVFCFDTR